jgi:hypothetical protein
MYVNPFLMGVLMTIGTEAVLLIIAALAMGRGGKRR